MQKAIDIPSPPLFFLSCSLLLSLLFDNFRGRGLPQLHNWKVSRHCVCYFRQSLGYAAEMGNFLASHSPADLFGQPGIILPGLGLPWWVAVATVKREKPIMVALWGSQARGTEVQALEGAGKAEAAHSASFIWLLVEPSCEGKGSWCAGNQTGGVCL